MRDGRSLFSSNIPPTPGASDPGQRCSTSERLVNAVEWVPSEQEGCSWAGTSPEGSLEESEERVEKIRAWKQDSLMKPRNTLQPWFDVLN